MVSKDSRKRAKEMALGAKYSLHRLEDLICSVSKDDLEFLMLRPLSP